MAFSSASTKLQNIVLSFSKDDLGQLTGFLTSHVALKYHLHKLKKAENQMCRLCQKDLEPAENIV